MAEPPASPCSASKLLVTTLTVSSDSSAGTYAATCGSQTLVVLTPSIRMLFELRLAPLTLNTRARDGFDGTECASAGGVKPGSTRNRYWQFRFMDTGGFANSRAVNSARTSARSVGGTGL